MLKNRLIVILCFFIAIVSISTATTLCKNTDEPILNVLMMHMVTEEMPEDSSLDTLYITADMLRKYCEYFKDRYTIVSLDEAYDIISNNKKVDNPNLLVFTFDDGYDNNYTLAYPILKEYGIKATISVIAKYTDENRPGYLTWDQVREMSDSGLIAIGSHTYDSHYYTTASDGISKPVLMALLSGETAEDRRKRIFTDLKMADDMISEVTGKKVNIMTYPYGVPPFDLMDEIAREFDYNIQILVRPGVNKGVEMFSKLKRFTVNGNQEPSQLEETMKKYNGLKFLEKFN